MAGAPTPPASVGARPAVTSCSLLGMDSLSVPASESGWVSPSHVCRHLPDACVEGLCPGLHRGPGPPPDAAPSLGSKWCEEESQASCFYLLVSALQVTCWLVSFCLVVRRNFFILENILIARIPLNADFPSFPKYCGRLFSCNFCPPSTSVLGLWLQVSFRHGDKGRVAV